MEIRRPPGNHPGRSCKRKSRTVQGEIHGFSAVRSTLKRKSTEATTWHNLNARLVLSGGDWGSNRNLLLVANRAV